MAKNQDYSVAKGSYDNLCGNHPEVVREMKELIDRYSASRDDVYSNEAGRFILEKHPRFSSLCGGLAAQVFGILLSKYMDSINWEQDTEDVRGKQVKVYRRP